jgi:GntR family transcriptional repressor for pyruvate dehydrogenase complex
VQIGAPGSVLTPAEERERAVLEIFACKNHPIGTGTVAGALSKAGWLWSDATVGRALRKLEQSDLLCLVGRSGRRLTPAGEAHLQALNSRREQLHHSRELADLLYRSGTGEIREILVARRAIERETASLAAAAATEQDLLALERVLNLSRRRLKGGTYGPEDDAGFHVAVAAASHNRILESALRLIRQAEWSFPVFLQVRVQAGSHLLIDHEEIFEAIAARDGALAEAKMVSHIEQVMADLQTVEGDGGRRE